MLNFFKEKDRQISSYYMRADRYCEINRPISCNFSFLACQNHIPDHIYRWMWVTNCPFYCFTLGKWQARNFLTWTFRCVVHVTMYFIKHRHNSLLHCTDKLRAYIIRPLSVHSQIIKKAYLKVNLRISTSILRGCNF